jgi:hypothetical protein
MSGTEETTISNAAVLEAGVDMEAAAIAANNHKEYHASNPGCTAARRRVLLLPVIRQCYVYMKAEGRKLVKVQHEHPIQYEVVAWSEPGSAVELAYILGDDDEEAELADDGIYRAREELLSWAVSLAS